jgi:hypothetical protein
MARSAALEADGFRLVSHEDIVVKWSRQLLKVGLDREIFDKAHN